MIDKTVVPPPIVVTTIARGEGEDASSAIPSNTIGLTGTRMPNVIIQTIRPIVSILVRTLRSFLLVFSGELANAKFGIVGAVATMPDIEHSLKVAFVLSLTPTILTLVLNTAELMAQIDQKFPKWRG